MLAVSSGLSPPPPSRSTPKDSLVPTKRSSMQAKQSLLLKTDTKASTKWLDSGAVKVGNQAYDTNSGYSFKRPAIQVGCLACVESSQKKAWLSCRRWAATLHIEAAGLFHCLAASAVHVSLSCAVLAFIQRAAAVPGAQMGPEFNPPGWARSIFTGQKPSLFIRMERTFGKLQSQGETLCLAGSQ